MNRESVKDILTSWCSLIIPFALPLAFLYLLIHSASFELWLSIPLLAIVFLIKCDVSKN